MRGGGAGDDAITVAVLVAKQVTYCRMTVGMAKSRRKSERLGTLKKGQMNV